MRFPDASIMQRVEELTDRIEQGSAAEVIVTVASRSGSYRDVDMTWGAIFVLLTLLVLVFSPLEVSEVGLLPNLLVAYALGWFLSRRLPFMRRMATSATRRRQQVRDAARLAFLDASLDATPARVGVMVYLSLLERDLEVVADHGVVGALGLAPTHEFRHAVHHTTDAKRLDVFMAALERYGESLQAQLPCGPETVHAIPNRPRVVRE